MKLVISEMAKQDLASIEEYTRDNWGKRQADDYLSQIENRFLRLLESPYLGTARPDVSEGYRCLPEGKHLIFYRVDDDAVNISGVPHTSMDLERHLESK